MRSGSFASSRMIQYSEKSPLSETGLYASARYLDRHGVPDFGGKGADHAVVTAYEAASHMPEARWLLEELAPKQPPLPVPSREVWLGYYQDMRQTPRIRLPVDFLADELRRRAPVLDARVN